MSTPQIIIVEDEVIIANDIKNNLINLGYNVPSIVTTGKEALIKIKGSMPDLVLMDIKLKGDMDGITTARQVQTLYDVPVIYMTANADKETIQRAKKTGAYGFIYKPVNIDVMSAVIEMALYKHNMEKQLKEREARLDATLQSIGDAVIATDVKGNITIMNPVAESLTGWKQSECEGKPLEKIFKIINANTHKGVDNPVKTVLDSGKIVGLANDTVLVAKDGKEFQIADSASPIRDAKDDITGVVLVFRDVTEEYQMREALRENEIMYRDLYNSMLEGVCLHELIYSDAGKAIDYRILDVNPKYEQVLGLKKDAVINKAASEIYGTDVPPYLDTYVNVAQTGKSTQFETYFPPMDKHFLISVFSPGKGRFATVFEDISEQKRNENELQESKVLLQAILDGISSNIAFVNDNLEIQWINKFAAESVNKTPEELIGQKCHMYWGDPEKPCENCPSVKAFQTKKTERIIQYAPDGQIWDEKGEPVIDSEGKVIGVVEFAQNITEHKKMEDALRHSEERFRRIIDNTQAGYFFIDKEGCFQMVNEAWRKMHKYSKDDEIIGKHFSITQVEQNLKEAEVIVNNTLNGNPIKTQEFSRKCKDGSIAYHTFTTQPVEYNNEIIGIEGFLIDITERKLIENSLKEAHVFLENMTDIAYVADANGNLVWVNSAGERVIGHSFEELTGNSFLPLFIEEDHESLLNVYERTLKGESLVNTLTFTSGITCQFTSLPKRNEKGVIVGSFGVARDITEQLKIEKALQVSEERLKKAQSVAQIGNWEYDIATGKVWGSEEAFRLYDIDRESEYLPLDLVENQIVEAKRVNQALIDLISQGTEYDIEFEIIQKNSGKSIILHSMAELIKDSNGNPVKVIGVIQNITDRKQAESQIQNDLKEKEILLKEIHHRVKNNMQIIISLLSLQSDKYSDQKIKGIFNQSKSRVYSMALVHEQLYLSNNLSTINMKSYIETLCWDLKNTFVPGQQIDFNIESNNVCLDINKAIPCGLLLNELISNSLKHGFSNKQAGKVNIILSMNDNKYCKLVVQDNGKGLPKKFNIKKLDTFGLKLVSMLTLQLEGELHVGNENGVKTSLQFSIDK